MSVSQSESYCKVVVQKLNSSKSDVQEKGRRVVLGPLIHS